MLLLDYLLATYNNMSRNKIKGLLTKGAIKVDGIIQTKYNYPVTTENRIEIVRGTDAVMDKSTRNMRRFATIEYEDPWLIVINKKTGVLSVPTGHHGFCLKTLLDEYLERKGEHRTTHVVHRLDKETSGLMIYAKSREIQEIFTNDWHNIISDRRYYAITSGIPQEERTIKSWLWDDQYGYVHSSQKDNSGKLAITHYRILKTNGQFALLDVKLETGRKNQIRVHLQDISCPVIGDTKYGNGINPIRRLGLHAYRLNFIHPHSHKKMNFETPLPAAFFKIIEKK